MFILKKSELITLQERGYKLELLSAFHTCE